MQQKIIIQHQIPLTKEHISILGIAIKANGSICCSIFTLSPFLFSEDIEDKFMKEFKRDFGFYFDRIQEFSFTISFISRSVRGGGAISTSIISEVSSLSMGFLGGEEFIPEAFYYPGFSDITLKGRTWGWLAGMGEDSSRVRAARLGKSCLSDEQIMLILEPASYYPSSGKPKNSLFYHLGLSESLLFSSSWGVSSTFLTISSKGSAFQKLTSCRTSPCSSYFLLGSSSTLFLEPTQPISNKIQTASSQQIKYIPISSHLYLTILTNMIRRKKLNSHEDDNKNIAQQTEKNERRRENKEGYRFNYRLHQFPEESENSLNVQYAGARKRGRKYQSQESYAGSLANQEKVVNRLRVDYDFEQTEAPFYNNANTRTFMTGYERSPSIQLNTSATDFSPQHDTRNSFYSTSLLNKTLKQTDLNTTMNFKTTQTLMDNKTNHQQDDLDLQYQQIWRRNQKAKKQSQNGFSNRRKSLSTKQHFDKQNFLMNRRLPIHQIPHFPQDSFVQRPTVTRYQGLRDITQDLNTLRVSQKKYDDNYIKTRKTSPTRTSQIINKTMNENVTLRNSPIKAAQFTNNNNGALQVNLRLVDEFSSKISFKMQELTQIITSLKLLK